MSAEDSLYDITRAINQLYRDEEDAVGLMRKVKTKEKDDHAELRRIFNELRSEYRECDRHDRQLNYLLKQEHDQLQALNQACDAFIVEVHSEQRKISNKYEGDLGALKRKKHQLEGY